MEPLKIIKEKPKETTGWKPITVKASLVDQLKEISCETGISVCSLSSKLLEYAIENMIIIDSNQEA